MPATCSPVTDDSVPAAVRRLSAEFGTWPPHTIELLVTRCRRDLDGAPPGALPELVERLARQRLLATP